MEEKYMQHNIWKNTDSELKLDNLIMMRDSCIRECIETNNEIYSLSREIEEREGECSYLLEKINKLQQSKNKILRIFYKSMIRKYQALYDVSLEIIQYKKSRQRDLKVLLKKYEEQRNNYNEEIKKIKSMLKTDDVFSEKAESKQMGE